MLTKLTKKRRQRSFLVLTVIVVLVLCVLGPALSWTHANVKSLAAQHDSRLSPVIMIPGSSASQNRFDKLVSLLNKQSRYRHSLLKLTVHTNDKITYSGAIRPRDTEPIIVVGFENNHDGYDNIKQQARWFSIAFKALTKQYQFNNFKAIGHSNGGLIYTYFFEHYFKPGTVNVKKIMTIGSPYNFEESSLNQKTQMLADFIDHRSALPKNAVMYSIAGTQNFDNDGIVPERSVEAGKYVYQGQVKHFTEIVVSGGNAQHSDLPQNQEIVEIINQYMLDHKK